MSKLRRSATWLAVVLALGVLMAPGRGEAFTSKFLIPDESPSLGDPDGNDGTRNGRVTTNEVFGFRVFMLRLWTGQIAILDFSQPFKPATRFRN